MGHPPPSGADYQRKGGQPTPDPSQRWRVVYGRGIASLALAQRAEQELWEAALARARLPVAVTGGPRSRPRIGFATPLPVGFTSDAERLDLLLTERRTSAEVRAALEAVVPADHRIVDLHDVWLGEPALVGRIVAADYRVTLSEAIPTGDLVQAVEGLRRADRIERVRRRGNRQSTYDLRAFLLGLAATPAPAEPGGAGDGVAAGGHPVLWMRLGVDPERGAGRPDEVVAALADAVGLPLSIAEGHRERLWTADELAGE